MNNVNKKMYNSLDIGKFICAFFILFYHYYSEKAHLPYPFSEILSLYAIAVGLFASISGFLIFNKLKLVKLKRDRWNCIKKQIIRIYRIYLIWSIPYLIYSISRWNFNTISIKFVFWKVQSWIFNSTFYTIWFMPMLAIGLLFTFFITEKYSEKIIFILGVSAYVFGTLFLTYSAVGKLLPFYAEFKWFIDTWLGGARGWLFYMFPFLLVGRFVALKEPINRTAKPFVLSCIFTILIIIEALLIRKLGSNTGIDMTIMMIPTVYFILQFLINLNIKLRSDLSIWLRNMSVLIYMSQRLFLNVIPHILNFLKIEYFSGIIGGIFVISLVILFSTFIIKISKKITLLKQLYL